MMRSLRFLWPFWNILWHYLVFVSCENSIIPLINLENESEIELAQEIRRACQETGFFAISNNGVNATMIQQAWDASRAFFDLDIEEKQKSISYNTTEYPYGYEQSESLRRGKAHDQDSSGDKEESSHPDLKETFAIGPSHPDSGMPPRRFPNQPPEFKEAVVSYYSAMEDLASRLLGLFAISLELPPDWFQDKFDKHQSALRLLNYPHLNDQVEPAPGQLRAGAHTDYGALTILKSGGPGLQVLFNGEWVDVPYLEDAFVINVGDLMQRWTNDKWVSTMHRVVVPPRDGKNHRRMSIAFFVNMNGEAQVQPIESCVSAQHPAKYGTITAGQHLMNKHLASMGLLRDEL